MSHIVTALARLLDAAYLDERPTCEQRETFTAAAHAARIELDQHRAELESTRKERDELKATLANFPDDVALSMGFRNLWEALGANEGRAWRLEILEDAVKMTTRAEEAEARVRPPADVARLVESRTSGQSTT